LRLTAGQGRGTAMQEVLAQQKTSRTPLVPKASLPIKEQSAVR
jgi:hypothetical protein